MSLVSGCMRAVSFLAYMVCHRPHSDTGPVCPSGKAYIGTAAPVLGYAPADTAVDMAADTAVLAPADMIVHTELAAHIAAALAVHTAAELAACDSVPVRTCWTHQVAATQTLELEPGLALKSNKSVTCLQHN